MSWSHYTPQIGVPTGCRPGPRNGIESNMLRHMAIQEGHYGRARQPSRVTESSLPLGSMMPHTDKTEESKRGKRRSPTTNSCTPLAEGGCVPYRTEVVMTRKATSRITESALKGWGVVEDTEAIERGYRQNDNRPPDNLSRGLRAECEVEQRGKAKIHGARAAGTTLSPSLVPCFGDTEETRDNPCDMDDTAPYVPRVAMDGSTLKKDPAIPFKRAYGLHTGA
ncbi:hypothetical protein FOL47_005861 [Perkinsus chesapeaki]|uniref:Uncharacterized protein n=1 Tax=Perkinsus chesapeaki TaxID=330153 RepID=A0A7J6LW72_PERCH|nr:hypothetical protein FOL47_005861 [Perkinsus chesapeaki]